MPGVRLILTSGEPLNAELARRVRAWAPNAVLVNQFGLTECTMTSAYHVVGDEDLPRGAVPIGRFIPSARGQLVDGDDELLPPGALGELLLAGPGLSRGYTSAALTAERYVPDRFGPPGSRCFRTGDLARAVGDGELAHHGRLDKQVKVRGVRVELDECEAALWRCPGVRAAVVEHRDGDLVAYVVGSATGTELRRRLAGWLPAAMVPNHYVRLDALPVTGNGKVDRRALPDHRAARARDMSPGPRDAAELRLRACWEDVLGREGIGVRDDFFALGGSSLTVLQLVGEIRARFRVEVAAGRVFAAPTIERLCAAEPGLLSAGGRLHRLRGGGADRAPVLLLPDLTGSAARLLPLADAISDGIPVLAMEAVGRAPNERPLERIGDMAAACLRELGELRESGSRPPAVLVGWGVGARVAGALAGLLRRAALGLGPGLVVAVHPDEEAPGLGAAAARYAAACGLGPLGDLDGRAALAALLRQERRHLRLPPHADPETMGRLLAVFDAAQAADMAEATEWDTPVSGADLLHVHGAGSVGPGRPDRVRGTGRTRSIVLPVRLGAVPGDAELRAVGEAVDRELSGAPC